MGRSPKRHPSIRTSWDPVARWYHGWVGKRGSLYHRKVAIPTVLELAELSAGQRLLDIGCGQGVLAPHVRRVGVDYVGIDASKALLKQARRNHTQQATFCHGDAGRMLSVPQIARHAFDVAVFMLSIQDMEPLEAVIASASDALKPHGRLVIFMTHPCFRVPRASGWGFDPNRKLTYRRVDRYLAEMRVPMKAYAEVSKQARGSTLSFHRPLTCYINTLARHGLVLDRLDELPDPLASKKGERQPSDIPLFVALRARK